MACFFGDMRMDLCIALILVMDPGIYHNFQAQIWLTPQLLFMEDVIGGMFFGDMWMDLYIALITFQMQKLGTQYKFQVII